VPFQLLRKRYDCDFCEENEQDYDFFVLVHATHCVRDSSVEDLDYDFHLIVPFFKPEIKPPGFMSVFSTNTPHQTGGLIDQRDQTIKKNVAGRLELHNN
jgi:hypothetical protein